MIQKNKNQENRIFPKNFDEEPYYSLPCRRDNGTTILIPPIFVGPEPLLNPAYAEKDTIRGLTTTRGTGYEISGFRAFPGAVSLVGTHPSIATVMAALKGTSGEQVNGSG